MVKVTVFGLAGSGTSTFARAFSEIYGFEKMSSGDIFRQKAQELEMTVSEFAQKCKADSSHDIELDNRVAEYGEKNNNFVFEGRLAWYSIPDSFKFKLSCGFKTRISRIMQREDESYEKVCESTLARESADIKRYQELYQIQNYSDDSHFDFILDSENNGPEELARQAGDYLQIEPKN